MFEARLKEASILKRIIEAIKDLVKTVNIDATSSGISMQAMDSSHVALVSLQLNESGFKSYRCDKSITLGLSIDNLSKILRCAGNDDVVTMRAEDEPSYIRFTFENEKQDKYSEFNLNLINIDSEQLGIPETEYSAIVTIPSNEFNRICKELQSLSESVTIEAQKEHVKMSIQSEHGSGSITLNNTIKDNKDDQVTLEVDSPVCLSFALRYLNLFNKASTLSNFVVLSMSDKTPLVVEYRIEKLGALTYYLAPKIDDEDDQQS